MPGNWHIFGNRALTMDPLTNRLVEAVSHFRSLNQLMIRSLQLITIPLPNVGTVAIEIAKQYWIDSSHLDLERARIECWEYLDERSASTNNEEIEYCANNGILGAMLSQMG